MVCSDLIALFCFCLRSLLRKHVFLIIPQRNVGSVDYLFCQRKEITVKFILSCPHQHSSFSKDRHCCWLHFISFVTASAKHSRCVSRLSVTVTNTKVMDIRRKTGLFWLPILEVSLDWLTLLLSAPVAEQYIMVGAHRRANPLTSWPRKQKQKIKETESTFLLEGTLPWFKDLPWAPLHDVPSTSQ